MRSRLFTVTYFPVRSSRSRALRYGLPSCMSVKTTKGAGGGLGGSKKKRGTAITSLARLLQKHVGLRDSSAKYQKSFVCLRTMCLMCYESVRLKETTTSQCRQLKLNPLSTQINIRRLMNNQTPALLEQRAP